MFTGIITDLGKLNEKHRSVFTFHAGHAFCKKLNRGTSVAVNGVCLTTVAKPAKDSFSVEIMRETQKRTMFENLKPNDLVNLELPATPNTFLSGHLISGHIDGTAKLRKMIQEGNSHILKFSIPKSLSQYIVKKGPIAVNGISLTVIEATKDYFTIGVIPYTWEKTMLQRINIGEMVNIEVDIIAKYLEKLLRESYEKAS
jgi:riboflavin synthase